MQLLKDWAVIDLQGQYQIGEAERAIRLFVQQRDKMGLRDGDIQKCLSGLVAVG